MPSPADQEPKKDDPASILPPGFLKLIALPMTFPANIAKSMFSIPSALDQYTFEVLSSLGFFLMCYMLFPSVIPILIFSGIAQFLLLVSSDSQDQRIAGGLGIFVLIVFCVMLSQGFLTL